MRPTRTLQAACLPCIRGLRPISVRACMHIPSVAVSFHKSFLFSALAICRISVTSGKHSPLIMSLYVSRYAARLPSMSPIQADGYIVLFHRNAADTHNLDQKHICTSNALALSTAFLLYNGKPRQLYSEWLKAFAVIETAILLRKSISQPRGFVPLICLIYYIILLLFFLQFSIFLSLNIA